MSIESKVLEKIKPSQKEMDDTVKVAEDLCKTVKSYLAEKKIDAEVMFVGSVAKGTFLSNPDIDLFLLFPEDFDEDEMNRVGLQAGKDIINGKEMYVEHPYTRGSFKGHDVDMVPCFHITSTEKLLTAVDRTPFHTKYVLSKVDEKMCDEIRLMKKFMKGIGTYGAEPDTRGFSGYMCELLVIKYGSFIDAIIAAAEWKKGEVIIVEKKGPMMVAPIVLYDPVDARRNVASAIHEDTLSQYIVACKAYLRNPSEKFFFPVKRKPIQMPRIKELIELHDSRLLAVEFDRPESNEDNIHAQIWKTEYALAKKLDSFSFNVLRSVHEMTETKIKIVFELDRDKLSKTHRHVGPPVWVKNCDTFLVKWKDNPYCKPFIHDGHWTTIADRLYTTATDMLADEAAIAGIGREIDPKTMVLFDNDATIKGDFEDLLTELLDPTFPWEN